MSDKDKKIHKCPTEGENYDSPQIILLAKETADIIKKEEKIKLNKDSIILDLGAGTGLIGLNFAKQVKHIIFEDVSKTMLDYLEYKCETQGIKNFTIFNGIIEDLNIKEKVDLITCGMVLHHIENLQKQIAEYKASMETDEVKGGQKIVAGGQKKWSETALKILELIKQNPKISRKELCEELKINPSAVQKHIEKLKEANKIERIGGAKGGEWRVNE